MVSVPTMRPIFVTCLASCALIAASAFAEPPTRPGEIAITDPAARDAGGPGHELAAAVAAVGVDYPVLLQQARRGETGAITLFAFLPSLVNLDGATAESFCSDQTDLLDKVGDAAFAQALKTLSSSALAACYRFLCYGLTPEPPGSAAACEAVKKRAPKTFAALVPGWTEGVTKK